MSVMDTVVSNLSVGHAVVPSGAAKPRCTAKILSGCNATVGCERKVVMDMLDSPFSGCWPWPVCGASCIPTRPSLVGRRGDEMRWKSTSRDVAESSATLWPCGWVAMCNDQD